MVVGRKFRKRIDTKIRDMDEHSVFWELEVIFKVSGGNKRN